MEIQNLLGNPFQGSYSIPLSLSIKFFLNHVSLFGMDWVEGLKNLSLSSRPPRTSNSLPIFLVASFEGLPISLDPDPTVAEMDPNLSPLDSSDFGYFLRSSAKKASGGLGKGKNPTSKGRGRKLYLAKAQSKAKLDLQDGKEELIE